MSHRTPILVCERDGIQLLIFADGDLRKGKFEIYCVRCQKTIGIGPEERSAVVWATFVEEGCPNERN